MPHAAFRAPTSTVLMVACMCVTIAGVAPPFARAAGPLSERSASAPQSALDEAVAALSSPDATARREALETIGAVGNPLASGAVARLIGDPQPDVQQAAIDTLLTLVLPATAGSRTTRASQGDSGGEARARQALLNGVQPVRPVPSGAFDPLAAIMSDADSRVRPSAAYAFGVLATSRHGLVPGRAQTRALAALAKMIASPHREVRLVAMEVSGRAFAAPPDGEPPMAPVAGEPLSNALIAAMNLPDMADQAAAMEALGRLRERRAVHALGERFVYHRENGPRQQAVVALEALARLGDPATASLVRPLIESAWTRSSDTRLAVLFARTRFFNDGSEEGLRRAANDTKTAAQARAYLLELGLIP